MYLSSDRVNDKTIIFRIEFIYLLLSIKDVHFVSLIKIVLLDIY